MLSFVAVVATFIVVNAAVNGVVVVAMLLVHVFSVVPDHVAVVEDFFASVMVDVVVLVFAGGVEVGGVFNDIFCCCRRCLFDVCAICFRLCSRRLGEQIL